ncbi:MAG: hypothetical protein WAN62_00255, partial [Candidatus Acidiferrum sp.]
MGKFASLLDTFLASPITWGVIALLALAIALSGKLSLNFATVVLWFAVGTALLGIYRAEAILRFDLLMRFLVMGFFAFGLTAAAVALGRWIRPEAKPPNGVQSAALAPALLRTSNGPEVRALNALPEASPKQHISESDRFTILIPVDTANPAAPIPADENSDDPHRTFYRSLWSFVQAGQNWSTEEERVDIVRRLAQMYIFHSVFSMARQSCGVELTGGKVIPINDKAIMPPDLVSSSAKDLIPELSKRRLLSPSVEMLVMNFPLHMPKGTHLSFSEMNDQESDKPFQYVMRMERPGFFEFDISVQPMGNANGGVLPDKFQSQSANTVKTYSLIIAMDSV